MGDSVVQEGRFAVNIDPELHASITDERVNARTAGVHLYASITD